MEAAFSDLAITISRESPSLAMAILILVLAYMLAAKLIPTFIKVLNDRADLNRERELRKKKESAERAKLEGQWLETQQMSNRLQEQNGKLMVDLSSKIDRDCEQRARVERTIGDQSDKIDDILSDMKILKERHPANHSHVT